MPRRRASSPTEPKPAPASTPVAEEKGRGGFRFQELGLLVSKQPDKASAILRMQLALVDGNRSAAARAVGTTYRSICRWIRLCKAAGFDPWPKTPAAGA